MLPRSAYRGQQHFRTPLNHPYRCARVLYRCRVALRIISIGGPKEPQCLSYFGMLQVYAHWADRGENYIFLLSMEGNMW